MFSECTQQAFRTVLALILDAHTRRYCERDQPKILPSLVGSDERYPRSQMPDHEPAHGTYRNKKADVQFLPRVVDVQ